MSIGRDTFALTKTDFSEKLSKIIKNFRANSRLIGEPKNFVVRACKLTERWSKLANDPDTSIYLRNIEIAAGRKVKVISLERGNTRQPVPKAKLVDELYPVKSIATKATPEEKHYNSVKRAMRGGIFYQMKLFRDSVNFPIICCITGKKLRPGVATDVDHVGTTFSEIADCFLTENKLRYTDIALVGPPTAKKFRLETLWESWKKFHNEKARYAIVLASANRSKGCGEYETPECLYGSFSTKSPEELSLDF